MKNLIFLAVCLIFIPAASYALDIPAERKPAFVNRAPLSPDKAVTHKIILERSPRKPMTPDRKQALQSLMLEKYDVNKNGKLDPEEMEAMKRDRIASSQGVRSHLQRNRVIDNTGKVDQQQLRHFMDRTNAIK